MNEEQKAGFELMSRGGNVFLTGDAGTGKSYLLHQFIKKSKYKYKDIAVTSTTGVSAQLLKGQTLHSWAGVGLGTKSASSLIKIIRSNNNKLMAWLTTKVLIIDEVSMLSGTLFNKLNLIGKDLRNNNRPFGGIQIIVVGDFHQLPVIQKINGYHDFCFKSSSWEECNFNIINLKTIVRQQLNREFTSILQNIRKGMITDNIKDKLNSRIIDKKKKDEIESNEIKPTILYSTNKNIDMENKKKLKELLISTKQRAKIFKLKIDELKVKDNNNHDEFIEKLIKPIKRISLAIGAQVMLTKNINSKLVNGSRGVVKDFNIDRKQKLITPLVKFNHVEELYPVDAYCYEYENDHIKLYYSQIPLKLAWATTIHKSQGSTLDMAIINLSNIFEYGQAYVALSRIRDFNDLYIEGKINFRQFKTHPEVLEFYNLFE